MILYRQLKGTDESEDALKYTKDFNIYDFNFWSGARDKVNTLDYDELDALAELIECAFEDYEPTETDINDFVWFDVNYITYDTYGVPQCGCEIVFHTDDEFTEDVEFMERVEEGYARIVEF